LQQQVLKLAMVCIYEVRFTPLGSDGFSKKRRKKEKKTTQHRTNTVVVVHKLFTKTLLYT